MHCQKKKKKLEVLIRSLFTQNVAKTKKRKLFKAVVVVVMAAVPNCVRC